MITYKQESIFQATRYIEQYVYIYRADSCKRGVVDRSNTRTNQSKSSAPTEIVEVDHDGMSLSGRGME